MPTNWLTLIWYGGAAIFGLLGLFLLIRWLIGDRSKGRRRCPKCWYDMSATSGLKCPECGKSAKSEKGLFRRRRRRRILVVGCLSTTLALAPVVYLVIASINWVPLLPTFILIQFVSRNEFASSVGNHAYWAQPSSSHTTSTLADELYRRWDKKLLSPQQRRTVMRQVIGLPNLIVEARKQTPRGYPLWCKIYRPVQAPYVVPNGFSTIYHGKSTSWHDATNIAAVVPADLIETANGNFITLKCGEDPRSPSCWEMRFAVTTRVVDTLEEVLIAVRDPNIDAFLRDNSIIRLSDNYIRHDRPTGLYVGFPTSSLLDGIRVAYRIDILFDNQPVAHTAVSANVLDGTLIWESDEAKNAAFDEQRKWKNPDDPRWSVRISGSDALALADLLATKWWDGQFTLTLRDLLPPE